MREILSHLPASAIVLDLGCSGGSFDGASYPFLTVYADLRSLDMKDFVQSDAARLPFKTGSFDAVICNHGLEHLVELKPALQEIGRVLKREAALFIAVPDASTFTDHLYRWLYNGGGHVNRFRNRQELETMLTWFSGQPHVATRTLYSSFSYMNPRNFHGGAPRKVALLTFRWEFPLALLNILVRVCDRLWGTRLSVYGWAMYFGHIAEEVPLEPWTNVCLRCGQGTSSDCMEALSLIRRTLGIGHYRCPACHAFNFYLDDKRGSRQRRFNTAM